MGRKAEERAKRKVAELEKFETNKANFLAKVNLSSQPKVQARPTQDPNPRLAPHLRREQETLKQLPKAIQDGSRFGLMVTWCVSKADLEGNWSWGEARRWSDAEWDVEIHPALASFGQMTWGDIDRCSSESGHKMHHPHEIGDLVGEAQTRWVKLGLEEFDTVFRFRLGGKKRAWGFVAQAHFHFVWWDREHALYPV